MGAMWMWQSVITFVVSSEAENFKVQRLRQFN